MKLEKKFVVEFTEDETIEDLVEILDRDEFAEPIVGSLGCEDCDDCDVFVCPTCDNEGLYETQAFCDDCGQRFSSLRPKCSFHQFQFLQDKKLLLL